MPKSDRLARMLESLRLDRLVPRLHPGVRNAGEGLDLMMTHDMTAWAALCGLMDECPVIHAAMQARGCHTIDPSKFEFISSNAQLASVREFLDALCVS